MYNGNVDLVKNNKRLIGQNRNKWMGNSAQDYLENKNYIERICNNQLTYSIFLRAKFYERSPEYNLELYYSGV